MNPRLACFSWRLLRRKTPTDFWAKQKGWAMASRCSLCLCNEEDDLHLLFFCPLDLQLWKWIMSRGVNSPTLPLFMPVIWSSLAQGIDAPGRKLAMAIFSKVIYVLWTLPNDSKHRNLKPSLARAKFLSLNRMRGLASSNPSSRINPHPILLSLGLMKWFCFSLASLCFLPFMFFSFAWAPLGLVLSQLFFILASSCNWGRPALFFSSFSIQFTYRQKNKIKNLNVIKWTSCGKPNILILRF